MSTITRPTTLFAAWLALLASFLLTHCGHQIEQPDSMSQSIHQTCTESRCVFGEVGRPGR